ncbi:Cof-type HAD-IIB family hydrolase [Ligilactobacillus faecis]|uniref:Cof-type HAD-IIB family hydrolase n=1 Tax=Ligilactobacillus faecis TaxID=762833 RepID=A0ABV4DR15_9LACO
MEQKLIAIDLDGTTLNNQSQITQKTKEVLTKAVQAGHIVSIVTGRPNRISENYYDFLGLRSPMINFNGAVGHIPHQQWDKEYALTFNKDITFEIMAKKQHLGIQVIAAEGKNMALADVPNTVIDDFFPVTLKANEVLNRINLKEDPSAMTMLVKRPQMKKVVSLLEDEFGDKINVGVWGGPNPILELSPKGVDKAHGVKFLADTYQIDRKNIVAFGDEHNDAEMIDYAGWGVVMQNGTKQLKALANDITPLTNEQDGLAHYLEEYLKLA